MKCDEIAALIAPLEARRARKMDLGLEYRRVGDAFLSIDPESDSIYPSRNKNRVINFGVESKADEAMIDEIIEVYRAADVRKFFLYLSPCAQSRDIEEWLKSRGMKVRNRLDVLFRDTKAVDNIASDFTIRHVGTKDAAGLLEGKFGGGEWEMRGFLNLAGEPDFDLFMAFDGDIPVATGLLQPQGNIGYLGFAVTHPNYRCQGAHRALIAARVAQAEKRGCEWVVSETYKTTLAGSYRNLVRCGFTPVYSRAIYQWKA